MQLLTQFHATSPKATSYGIDEDTIELPMSIYIIVVTDQNSKQENRKPESIFFR